MFYSNTKNDYANWSQNVVFFIKQHISNSYLHVEVWYWSKRRKHKRRKKLCYITSEVFEPHVSSWGVCVLKEWDLLWAHSTAYKLEDYLGPGCGYSVRFGQVYRCLWESECLSVCKRWGERLSLYTVLKCVNNLVCSTVPQGVKVWRRGSLLRVATVMFTCSFLNSTCPKGFIDVSHKFVNLIPGEVFKYRDMIIWYANTISSTVHTWCFKMDFVKAAAWCHIISFHGFYTTLLHYLKFAWYFTWQRASLSSSVHRQFNFKI